MKRIVLRVRPLEVIEDLDLALLQERAALLADRDVTVHDSRLSDAPYLSIVVRAEDIDAELVSQLKAAFADLPRMRALLWRRSAPETPLVAADLTAFRESAEIV